MKKKVLVMCTGNSCRSIIGEALINAKLDGVEAYSCGVAPSGKVNPNAKKVLEQKGIWKDEYHSKNLDEVIDIPFDLVVTVCDHANETCPMFPRPVNKIHIGFEDPDGKEFEAFETTYAEIEEVLLPKVKAFFEIKKEVSITNSGVNIKFTGNVSKDKIFSMVQNCQSGQCECMSDITKAKITNMAVSGNDGNVKLELSGDINEDEIKEALKKSKVLN
jgi:arsenate reductase (thioredoxin)